MLPVTGTPLPFISVGGSSLVSFMVAAGVLVNIARHNAPAAVPRSERHPAVRARTAGMGPRPAVT
jgi:cell division protein FtsW